MVNIQGYTVSGTNPEHKIKRSEWGGIHSNFDMTYIEVKILRGGVYRIRNEKDFNNLKWNVPM